MDEKKDQVQNEKPVNENPNDEVIETIEEVEIIEEPVEQEDDGIRELAGYGNTNLKANSEDADQDEDDDEDENEEVEAEIVETADPETIAKIDSQIQQLMKKYKMSMWALVACIVLYLIFLFIIKTAYSTWVVLGICVVMIGIAVYNTKISKQVQRLALEKRRLTNPKAAQSAPAGAMSKSTAGAELGQVDDSEPIVANAASLNDLPKQYTVLDDVEFSDGQRAQNVIVSPYGVAVVGSPDLRPEVDAVLQEANVEEVPIFFYSPDEEVSVLAEKIQMEKMVVLDEGKIMEILLKLTGIKR